MTRRVHYRVDLKKTFTVRCMFESESALYWRRRGVAIASVVAVVLLLVWAMSGPSRSPSDDRAGEELNAAGVSLQSPAEDEPVPPAAGEPVGPAVQPVGTAGQHGVALPGSGLPSAGQPGALPAAGLPSAGLPAAGLPAAGLPAAGLPGSGQAGGLPAAGLPASGVAGLPATGSPVSGLPAAGLPTNGLPTNGLPTRGLPTSGLQTRGLPTNGLPAGTPTNGLSAARSTAAGSTADALPGTSTATGQRSTGQGSTGQGSTGQLPSTAAGSGAGQATALGAPESVTGRTAAGGAQQARGINVRPAAVPVCSDKAVSVQAQTGADSYKIGQKPHFQLMVTNLSGKPCTRDLDAGLQEMVVTGSNQARLWSSNDCFPAKRTDLRTLQPGKPEVFPLDWAGRTSRPGCAGERSSIGPGSYSLTGKLGTLSSGPARFTIVK
jgi:hypothetical protein